MWTTVSVCVSFLHTSFALSHSFEISEWHWDSETSINIINMRSQDCYPLFSLVCRSFHSIKTEEIIALNTRLKFRCFLWWSLILFFSLDSWCFLEVCEFKQHHWNNAQKLSQFRLEKWENLLLNASNKQWKSTDKFQISSMLGTLQSHQKRLFI